MKKKVKWLAVFFLIISAMLVGCSNDSKSDAKGDGKEITYALWDKEQAPIYEELAKEFEEETGIKVKFEITPWAQYWTKLETAITGNNAPDVFWINFPRVPDYIDNEVVLPLDDIEFDKDKFPQQYLDSYTRNGKLYAIPKDFDSHALYYNKKIFDEANIAYPDDTWTWDTWREVAKKLTNKDKNIYGMAAPVTWQGGYYETLLQSGGAPFAEDGTKSGFSDSKTIAGVQFWYDFVKEGSSPTVEEMASTTVSELFLNGRIAMTLDGSYMVPTYFTDEYGIENIDVAPMPKGEIRATTSNALANAISAKTENEEAAKKWVAYLSTKEANEHTANSGKVLSAYEGSQEGWMNAYPDKNLKVFIDAVEYAVPLPNKKNNSAAIAIEADILTKAWTGEITVEEACLELAKQADELLKK